MRIRSIVRFRYADMANWQGRRSGSIRLPVFPPVSAWTAVRLPGERDTIVAPEKFEVTDADYNDFKALVKKADFKYDQQSEKILKTLKEAAEFEGYMADASEEFKALEKKLNHDLDRDLDYFSGDIKKMIASEIIKRYYYQRGNIIQQLKDDDGLKEAVKILNDPVKYKEMLSAPVAKK